MSDQVSTPSGAERIAQLLTVMQEVELLVQELGYEAYIVGGAVRDLLVADVRASLLKDLDIAIAGDARVVGRMLAAKLGATATVHDRFLTANLVFPHLSVAIDLTTTRSETYERPGVLPTVLPAGIEEDLARRDFTVNAMAVPLSVVIDILMSSEGTVLRPSSEILDPFGGQQDLLRRSIHVLHPESFLDDPTRLFRALRYEVRLGGSLSPETSQLFAAALAQPVPHTVSVNRILTEVRKALAEEVSVPLLTRMFDTGLLSHALDLRPSGTLGNLEATLKAIADAQQADRFQRWVVLMGFFFWAGMASNPKIESAIQIRRPILKQLYQMVDRARDGESFPQEAMFSTIVWSK